MVDIGVRTESSSQSGKPHVLMLSYNIPPRAGGGVFRILKFVKYLPSFGWNATVIAPDWARSDLIGRTDHTLAREIDTDVDIVHAGTPPPQLTGIWRLLWRLPGSWRWAPKLKRNLDYPDAARWWESHALKEARQILRARSFNTVYSTSPPSSTHRIALRLKQEYGIPWVADFRDPWTDNALTYGGRIWSWRKHIDRRLERRVYRFADLIIANTPANRRQIIEGHGVAPEKVITITNGYDEDDFCGVIAKKPENFFRVTYTGSSYGSYTPGLFVEALQLFLRRRPDARVRFTIAGSSCEWAARNINAAPLESAVELLGPVPHRDIPQLLTSSHLLLQVCPNGIAYCVPGKLYEYLRSGSPIIAICERPSEVARILAETGHGRAFTHNELESIVDYLENSYDRWQAGEQSGHTGHDQIRSYDRETLTGQLVAAFERVGTRDRKASK